MPARVRTFFALPAAIALAISLSGCASGPAGSQTIQGTTPVTHNCKPQETVGFSCELQDQRLLSMCASPGFENFEGPPKDNPGYAYLVVGTQKGDVQYSYPPSPSDYKRHFFKGVPTNHIPYMFVTSDKGRFFFLAEQDDTNPRGAGQLTPENLPDGWEITTKNIGSAKMPCKRLLNFENFHKLGVSHETVWFKERDRIEAERSKRKQP